MAEINNLAAAVTYSSLVDALRAAFGEETEVTEQKRVYGGDINDAYELHLSGGQRIFMKTNQINNYRFFETEARGLEALRSARAIGVPQLLGIGTDRQRGFSFLLLEYMESASPIKDYWEVFGQQLAQMHLADCRKGRHLPGEKPDTVLWKIIISAPRCRRIRRKAAGLSFTGTGVCCRR